MITPEQRDWIMNEMDKTYQLRRPEKYTDENIIELRGYRQAKYDLEKILTANTEPEDECEYYPCDKNDPQWSDYCPKQTTAEDELGRLVFSFNGITVFSTHPCGGGGIDKPENTEPEDVCSHKARQVCKEGWICQDCGKVVLDTEPKGELTKEQYKKLYGFNPQHPEDNTEPGDECLCDKEKGHTCSKHFWEEKK